MRKMHPAGIARLLFTILAAAVLLAELPQVAHARNPQGKWGLLEVGAIKPPARRHCTMVYDSLYDRVIMFGGDQMVNGVMTVYNDLWALNMSGVGAPYWQCLQQQDATIDCSNTTRPCRRHGHVAAIVPGTPNRMFVHGGKNAADVRTDDTWELTLTATPTWTRRSASITAALDRYHHAAFYYAGGFRIFGGRELTDVGMADTWSMNLANNVWSHVSGNKTASGAACAWPTHPCPIPSDVPERRYWHSIIADTHNNAIVTFGGLYNNDPTVASNVWKSTDGGHAWTFVGTAPAGMGRNFHTASYDKVGHRMVVVGGNQSDYPDPDFMMPGGPEVVQAVTAMELDSPGYGTWSPLSPAGAGPGQIAEHAAIYDSQRDRIILFGGVDENATYLNDTWVLGFNDVTPPAAITNLSVYRYFTNAITFAWTAHGDDADSGLATSYEIRYSSNPITDEASFYAASLVNTPPTPSAAGTQDTVKISLLNPSTIYYVAIKIVDEANNKSATSNVMCARISPHVLCDGGALLSPLDTPPARPGRVEFALRTPKPNPTSGPLDISFALAERGRASLELLDLAGRRVSGMELGDLEPGEHTAHLSPSLPLAPGYYFVRLRQGRAMLSRPVLIVR